MTFSVQSEVGQLRQAIIHRPGLELSRLTPQNIGGLLFDDVLWARKASRLRAETGQPFAGPPPGSRQNAENRPPTGSSGCATPDPGLTERLALAGFQALLH